MKTYSPTPESIDRQWFLVDAQDQILGRLASQIAHRLRGKHKPEFAPHMDNGDFIVVVNCEKIKVTGNKLQKKNYYHHTGYVGNLKSITLENNCNKNRKKCSVPLFVVCFQKTDSAVRCLKN